MKFLILIFRTTLEGRGSDSWWIISRSSQLQWRFDQIIQFYWVQRQTQSICCLCEPCPTAWTQFELESKMFVSCRRKDHIIGWFQTLFRKKTSFLKSLFQSFWNLNIRNFKKFWEKFRSIFSECNFLNFQDVKEFYAENFRKISIFKFNSIQQKYWVSVFFRVIIVYSE